MDVNGVKFAKVINQMVNGMELGGMTFDKVEIDREIDRFGLYHEINS